MYHFARLAWGGRTFLRRIAAEAGARPLILEILDRAALDPDGWIAVCDELSRLVGGSGGVLVPHDMQTWSHALPHSRSVDEVLSRFFTEGWHARDSRRNGFARLMTVGHVADQDLVTDDQMKRDPYYREWLEPAGLRWFVGLGFRAGQKWWSAAVHGSVERGPFVADDVGRLEHLRGHLSLAARRAMALGNQRVESLEAAFAAVSRGVAVLGWSGRIVWQNERAEQLLREGDLSAGGRLRSADPALEQKLSDLVSRAAAFHARPTVALPGPVLAPVGADRYVSIDLIPMPRDFCALVGDTSALLTLHEVSAARPASLDDLASRFRLTRREIQLAAHLMSGSNLSLSAERMEISTPTARQYVKSVFAKTGTHAQAELVALLARSMN